jgi:hypothetical protein
MDGQTWEWDCIDRHHVSTPEKEEQSYQHEWSPLGLSLMEVFLAFLPLTFLLETVVYNASDAIELLGEPPLGWGGFLPFLGLWCIMRTVSGFSRDDFWDNNTQFDQCQNHCPYQFNPYMSRRPFKIILRELCFTGKLPPWFTDKFWQVRQLISAFNKHMATFFCSSWVICLDESMSLSIWQNRWACLGLIFVPQNHTHLVMSTILYVVSCLVSCSLLSLLRVVIDLEQLVMQSLINMIRHVVSSFT